MISLKKHLRENKVKWIHKFSEDFEKEFNIKVPHGTGFTRSDMFYFANVDGKKYVHKEALRFVLTNGDSYFMHQENSDEFIENSNDSEREAINEVADTIFTFIRNEINNHKLFPELIEETKYFFVFKYYQDGWENLTSLTREDAEYIKKHYYPNVRKNEMIVTPLYNQMYKKIVRNIETGELKFVDIKSLELRKKNHLMVYICQAECNDLYLMERRFVFKQKVVEPFLIDYPANVANLIKYF